MLPDSRRAVVTGDLPAAVGSGFVALVSGEAERLFQALWQSDLVLPCFCSFADLMYHSSAG